MSELNPATCTDLEWFTETGLCGGCGDEAETCHPGQPCGNQSTWYDIGFICDLCHYRDAQGLVRRNRDGR